MLDYCSRPTADFTFPQYRSLNSENCQLTDDTVDTLTSKLTKLTVLKLSGNKIGPIACRFITERLHQLEVLHLGSDATNLESNSLC